MSAREHPTTETQPPKLSMSYEEYLRWADDSTLAEWVGGEVIIHMPPTGLHLYTLLFIAQLLSLFADFYKLGRVIIAPFEMRITPEGPSREPDILFVSTEHLDRLTPQRLVGPADLIIEIVSNDSVQRDRRDKFREYRDAGVPEYWIIDPRPGKQRADIYRRTDNGDFELFATEDEERIASCILQGFWLRPTWLWQTDTVQPFSAFCEMVGVTSEVMALLRKQIEDARKS